MATKLERGGGLICHSGRSTKNKKSLFLQLPLLYHKGVQCILPVKMNTVFIIENLDSRFNSKSDPSKKSNPIRSFSKPDP